MEATEAAEKQFKSTQEPEKQERLQNGEPPIGYIEALGSHASNPPNPRTVGEQIFALGEWFTIADDENGIKAQYEQYLRGLARGAAQEAFADGDVEGAQRLDAAYIRGRAAGDFKWGGKAWTESLAPGNNFTASIYLFYLLLRRCHPDMTEKKAALIFKENPLVAYRIVCWAVGNFLAPESAEIAGAAIKKAAEKKMKEANGTASH